MQVIWALALQHSSAAVTHEVSLMYVGQIQDSSTLLFHSGAHRALWSSEGRTFVMRSLNLSWKNFDQNVVVLGVGGLGVNYKFFSA